MIAAVVIATALALPTPSPVDLGTSSTCRLISQVTVNDERKFCCESCLAPYLLDSEWVTWENVNVEEEEHLSEHQSVDVSLGSGSDAPELSASVSNRDQQRTRVIFEDSGVVPCGKCVTPSDCLATSGYVNTWHRLCQRGNALQ